MKIVFLTLDVNPKLGLGRYSSILIENLKDQGHEVVVLKERDDGLEGEVVLLRGKNIISSAIKIRKYIKDCDIIHAMDAYPYAIIGALANIGLNKKFVITGHGSYAVAPLYNRKTAWLMKWAYRQADSVVAISDYTKSEMLKKVDLDKVEVIRTGVEYDKFFQKREDCDEEFIISVGAVKSRKGYVYSLNAFIKIKKKFPHLKYKIVAHGKQESYYRQLIDIIKSNNLENDVEFLFSISDKELLRLYRRAKIFILTSVNDGHHFEGYGLVFLEAAASGLPVIGTLGNGIVDAVMDGKNGILVPQADINKTAEAMIKILDDKDLYNRFSSFSYEWASQNDKKKAIKYYIGLFQRILNLG
jgi:phosphatidylinositol alpha-1,6-mannosyltransferase